MSKHQEKMKKVMGVLAQKMIDHDTYEWPPVCSIITYQPTRPHRDEKKIEMNAESGNKEQ